MQSVTKRQSTQCCAVKNISAESVVVKVINKYKNKLIQDGIVFNYMKTNVYAVTSVTILFQRTLSSK